MRLSRADREHLMHMLAGGITGLIIGTVIMFILAMLHHLAHTGPIPI